MTSSVKLIDPDTGKAYRAGGSANGASGDVKITNTPLPVQVTNFPSPEALAGGTDRSGVTVVGAKEVAVANSARRGFDLQNTSDTEMRVTESGAAATATSGYIVAPGGRFGARTNRAVSVFCATAGKAYAATEW